MDSWPRPPLIYEINTWVWLMGVWERSPAGIRVSMTNTGLLADFRRASA